MNSQIKKGLLEICVLRTIEEKDSYGYEIIKNLENYIVVSESTLYPILRRLEEAGELTSYTVKYNNRLRKYFKITSSGTQKLQLFRRDLGKFSEILAYINDSSTEF